MNRMERRVHVAVSGRVQGVYFRANTRERAQALGLSGWVRNLPDGRVEIVAEGEEERLSQFLSWVRVGPPAARVEQVEVEWSEPRGERDFAVRRDEGDLTLSSDRRSA
jgi:acylphosphatase